MESAIKLAERLIAGGTKPARPASEPSTLDHRSGGLSPLPGASRGFYLLASPFASLCVFRGQICPMKPRALSSTKTEAPPGGNSLPEN
jgi:hypothetical protein